MTPPSSSWRARAGLLVALALLAALMAGCKPDAPPDVPRRLPPPPVPQVTG